MSYKVQIFLYNSSTCKNGLIKYLNYVEFEGYLKTFVLTNIYNRSFYFSFFFVPLKNFYYCTYAYPMKSDFISPLFIYPLHDPVFMCVTSDLILSLGLCTGHIWSSVGSVSRDLGVLPDQSPEGRPWFQTLTSSGLYFATT